MHPSILLSPEDHAQLTALLNHEQPGPWPDARQAACLAAVLHAAKITSNPAELDRHSGLGDRVSLVSTNDPRDTYEFQPVMPAEADVDDDKLPVTHTVALAVLGRRTGEVVAWDCPAGRREMTVTAVQKTLEGAVSA